METTEKKETQTGTTWIPLNCGFTEEQKKEFEERFGADWMDLFNGL